MTREEDISRMRARHSLATRREDPFPVTGPWSLRELCEHEHGWRDVDEHWQQCRVCWWCRPRLGKPPAIRVVPALLKGRVLPPLSGKTNLHKVFRNAGFVMDDDRRSVLSIARVTIAQYAWGSALDVRRCGVEVKFKDHGWCPAATFNETALYRLVEVLSKAEPRKPRKLWLAIQETYSQGWKRPWE